MSSLREVFLSAMWASVINLLAFQEEGNYSQWVCGNGAATPARFYLVEFLMNSGRCNFLKFLPYKEAVQKQIPC